MGFFKKLFGKKEQTIPSLDDLESSFGDKEIIEESEGHVMFMMGEKDFSSGKPPVFQDDVNYMAGYESRTVLSKIPSAKKK